ncbi:MAG: DUF4159 domain-containing protein [Planctomycetaceae bacterium]
MNRLLALLELLPRPPVRVAMKVTAVVASLWVLATADWLWFRPDSDGLLTRVLRFLVFVAGALLALGWAAWASLERTSRPRHSCAAFTAAFVVFWQMFVYVCDALAWHVLTTQAARIGTALMFLIGLMWVVYGVEMASQFYERMRRESADSLSDWNPLDQTAWYYGRHARKLNQSVTALVSYSFVFALTFLLLGQIGGCSEIYEMPAGGGEQQQIVQQVKVQKVIKRRYIVNPFSAILFHVPPIDDIKLQLTELTHHAYKVGYGQGKGAGYAGGTKFGKVRFIRLEYSGGDWDQDFGIGADLNMLIEYNVRTQQKVHDKTESRTVMQLNNFPLGKSPPMVYLTGQKSISLSQNEVKALRNYLTEKHGMVFGDNGGSSHFHNQFLSMMRRVLPTIDPVPVPLDDVIHRIPYQIPFLPYVAPHGGTVALGWKVDGRWVCYYHPGDIGDAWADGHAGVSPEIFEYCYQLGTNIINYSHAEYSKWLEARKDNQ